MSGRLYVTGWCGTDQHRACRERWSRPCACTCGHPAPVFGDDRPTAVSLFAGVGGIDLALERAGYRVVAAVEINPAARGVLRERFPDVTLFNDVTEVSGDQLRAAGFVARGGLLAAGWPCQDNSVAGRRAGMGGARSGLWSEVARLLAELRPAWFLGENVPGLLSVNGGRDFAAVVRDVAQVGMGCAWRVLDAQHFGVPQQRRRVFVVGCAGDRAAPVQVLLESEGGGGDPAAGRSARQGVAAITASSAGSGCGADDNDAQGGRLIVSTLMAGSPTSYRAGPDEAAAGHLIVGTIQTRRGGGGLSADEAAAGQLIATTLTTNSGASYDDQQIGQLVPFDLAQITSGENRSNPQPGAPCPALAATGRPHVASTLTANPSGGGRRQEDDTNIVTHALTSEGADASEDGTGRGTPLTLMDAAVRRLTPLECERLQGLPDGWTAVSDGKAQADSPRYRQIGNCVAVPVVEWIARRIVAATVALEAAA